MLTTIIFDLGGVLIDWNPEYLYRKIFDDETEMKQFLQNVCTSEWNEEQDGGRLLQEATETLIQQYPEHEENITAFYSRWPEMLGGEIQETVEVFKELKESKKYKFYALTNWSSETFPVALERYPFLEWFDGIVVSGIEKLRKPFPEFYELLLQRYQLKAAEVVFIDDNKRNIEAARKLGIDSIPFTDASQMKEELIKRQMI